MLYILHKWLNSCRPKPLAINYYVFLGHVAIEGSHICLVCPGGQGDGMFEWSFSSDNNSAQIASYIPSDPVVRVKQLWGSRGWTIDSTNGDLIIPMVVLADERVYYCGGIKHKYIVKLDVSGEI